MPQFGFTLSYLKDSFQETTLKAKLGSFDECKLIMSKTINKKNILFLLRTDEKYPYKIEPDFEVQSTKPVLWLLEKLQLISTNEYRCMCVFLCYIGTILISPKLRCGNIIEIPGPISDMSISLGFQKNSSLRLLFDSKAKVLSKYITL